MTASTIRGEHQAHAAHDPSVSQRLGVILLIIGDLSFVVSLMFTYFYLRGLNTDGGWIPAGAKTLPVASGWIIAVPVILSVAAYLWGLQGIRTGDSRRLGLGVLLGLLLVLVGLGLQVDRLVTMPFSPGTGSYASIVITIGGYHLVHLLVTLVLGLGIWSRARRGLFSRDAYWHAQFVGYWWTWVAISAVLFAFTTSFIASPHVV